MLGALHLVERRVEAHLAQALIPQTDQRLIRCPRQPALVAAAHASMVRARASFVNNAYGYIWLIFRRDAYVWYALRTSRMQISGA